MRIEKCYFCSSSIYPGHGMKFVRNDCKIFRFCRSKCHKAFKMKRNPRKVRWTKAYRKATGKEMTIDPVYEFEKRRHEPVKYDRELWADTVKAVSKVSEIREKRERAHVKKRINSGRKQRQARQIKEIEKHIDLLEAPEVGVKKLKQKVSVKLRSSDIEPMEM
eukprot:m.123319 g.123319  ORF g.123319 m.123319 type:complete len:163 (+) comp16585_c5_seq5:152-640(+)